MTKRFTFVNKIIFISLSSDLAALPFLLGIKFNLTITFISLFIERKTHQLFSINLKTFSIYFGLSFQILLIIMLSYVKKKYVYFRLAINTGNI